MSWGWLSAFICAIYWTPIRWFRRKPWCAYCNTHQHDQIHGYIRPTGLAKAVPILCRSSLSFEPHSNFYYHFISKFYGSSYLKLLIPFQTLPQVAWWRRLLNHCGTRQHCSTPYPGMIPVKTGRLLRCHYRMRRPSANRFYLFKPCRLH